MITLSDAEKRLAERLLIMLRDKEPFVYYDELADYANIKNPRLVGGHLGKVSELCHQLGLPLLSAKVVNKNTGVPGAGFYALCKQLGVSIEGKTNSQLFSIINKKILACKDWYRLENYLGLDVGLDRPVNHKFLDVRKPQYYQHSEDVLNSCFDVVLGKTYNGYMQGSKPFEKGHTGYAVWFPKLSLDGTAASSSDWVNILSDDGSLIQEYGGHKRFDTSGRFIFVFAKKGSEPYFFRGVFKVDDERSTDAHRYYYKVADSADLTSSVPVIHFTEDEYQQDNLLISDLQKEDFSSVDGFEYKCKPLPVPEPLKTGGRLVYPRNRQTSVNALVRAGYACEIDSNHPTFNRKHSGIPYTEPHHLVPMSQQGRFTVSLDVEENIVSLCSTCHNHIHYGQDASVLIKQLFNQRKDLLRSVGIIISEDELLSYYR